MNNRHVQQLVIRRFSENHVGPDDTQARLRGEQPRTSQHLIQFLKMAEHRKRQILEKMLLD